MSIQFNSVVGTAFRESKKMAPVASGKSAIVAFFAGFLFGPFGVGLYLWSFADFIVLMGLVLLGSVVTVGVAAPVLWVLCGAWGATRVNQANKALPG